MARFICGFLHCEQEFNPLFGSLPRLMCVRSHEGDVVLESVDAGNRPSDRPVPFHAGMWLNTTIYYLIKEAQSPGSHMMLERLTELMFVEASRRSCLIFTESRPSVAFAHRSSPSRL